MGLEIDKKGEGYMRNSVLILTKFMNAFFPEASGKIEIIPKEDGEIEEFTGLVPLKKDGPKRVINGSFNRMLSGGFTCGTHFFFRVADENQKFIFSVNFADVSSMTNFTEV